MRENKSRGAAQRSSASNMGQDLSMEALSFASEDFTDVRVAGDDAEKVGVHASRYSAQKVPENSATLRGNSWPLAIVGGDESDRRSVSS